MPRGRAGLCLQGGLAKEGLAAEMPVAVSRRGHRALVHARLEGPRNHGRRRAATGAPTPPPRQGPPAHISVASRRRRRRRRWPASARARVHDVHHGAPAGQRIAVERVHQRLRNGLKQVFRLLRNAAAPPPPPRGHRRHGAAPRHPYWRRPSQRRFPARTRDVPCRAGRAPRTCRTSLGCMCPPPQSPWQS